MQQGIDGSPQDETCANSDSCRTADHTSPSEVIRASREQCAGVVPLFLVPRAVADAIRHHGRAIREIHVRRTRNHFYTINVEREVMGFPPPAPLNGATGRRSSCGSSEITAIRCGYFQGGFWK